MFWVTGGCRKGKERKEKKRKEKKRLEKKRKDYAFRHQFNEKPSIIPAAQALGLHEGALPDMLV